MDRQILGFCPICHQGTYGHNGRTWIPCGCKNSDNDERRERDIDPRLIHDAVLPEVYEDWHAPYRWPRTKFEDLPQELQDDAAIEFSLAEL